MFLISVSIDATAQYRNLLARVPASELPNVREKNDYFIRKLSCHVKQYRFATVDMSALLSNEPIRIHLFDNESIVIHPTTINYKNGGVILWYGMPEDVPNYGPNPYLAGQQLKKARERYEESYEVTIGASVSATDSETGANYWKLGPASPTSEAEFYSLSANLRSLDRRKSYRIERVDMGGPYHVIYERDTSIGPMPGPADEYPEREEMRQKYRRCIESLGADPHRAALLDFERRKREQ